MMPKPYGWMKGAINRAVSTKGIAGAMNSIRKDLERTLIEGCYPDGYVQFGNDMRSPDYLVFAQATAMRMIMSTSPGAILHMEHFNKDRMKQSNVGIYTIAEACFSYYGTNSEYLEESDVFGIFIVNWIFEYHPSYEYLGGLDRLVDEWRKYKEGFTPNNRQFKHFGAFVVLMRGWMDNIASDGKPLNRDKSLSIRRTKALMGMLYSHPGDWVEYHERITGRSNPPLCAEEKDKYRSKSERSRNALKADDCYYTLPCIAEMCMDFLNERVVAEDVDHWLEPACGAGAFLDLMPKRLRTGVDINPCGLESSAYQSIVKQDFLHWRPVMDDDCIVATVGNPPFSDRTSDYCLARDFFRHAAEFSKVIAFILPQAFSKYEHLTIADGLLGWELLDEMSLPYEAFTIGDTGEPYGMHTVFQVWLKS